MLEQSEQALDDPREEALMSSCLSVSGRGVNVVSLVGLVNLVRVALQGYLSRLTAVVARVATIR